MKKLLSLIFAFSIFSLAEANVLQQSKLITYTCVMHPEIHVNKPGNCPKCGMTLIKEKTKKDKTKSAVKPAKTPTVKQTDLVKQKLQVIEDSISKPKTVQ